MANESRLRKAAIWFGTGVCALIALTSVANVLFGRLTAATGPWSEVGIRGGAIVADSWEGADWPMAAPWAVGDTERTLGDWSDEWAQNGVWPSRGREDCEQWTTIPLWIPFLLAFSLTMYLWRNSRKWAVIAAVALVSSFASTRVLARYFYNLYWPGNPDQFRAETALLPQFSFKSYGTHFWQDAEQALIFLSACGVYLIPPLLGLALSRRRAFSVVVIVATVVSVVSAINDVWGRWQSYFELFYPKRAGFWGVSEQVWPDLAWVVGLSIAGLAVGYAFQSVARRRRLSVGHCAACGYDLRAQIALAIPRCPECGRLVNGSDASSRAT